MTGALFVVSTPIGNIKDITLRALETLKEADFIVCEDTRETKKLLSHYSIHEKNALISFFTYNQQRRIPEIIGKLKSGCKIALVSERGTPGISDPGFFLIDAVIKENLKVVTVPGTVAFAAAIVASGLPTDDFVFLGFLRKKPGKLKRQISEAAVLNKTIIFYESPKRLKKTLAIVKEIMPASAKICIARELTKTFEEFIRGRLDEIEKDIRQKDIRGELVVLIHANSREKHHD